MRGTWDDLNRRLTAALLALDLGDVLVIAERIETPKKRFRAAPPPRPARFVQVTAARGALIGECIGSRSFGGDWEMSPDLEATLERQGWDRPWSAEFRTYQREAVLTGAPHLALAVVRTLQALGCEMADLDVRLDRDEEIANE